MVSTLVSAVRVLVRRIRAGQMGRFCGCSYGSESPPRPCQSSACRAPGVGCGGEGRGGGAIGRTGQIVVSKLPLMVEMRPNPGRDWKRGERVDKYCVACLCLISKRSGFEMLLAVRAVF